MKSKLSSSHIAYMSADLVPGGLAPSLAKYHVAMFKKIMYVVHIKLSTTATIQFEIHPRCQETKETSSQPDTVHHVLTVTLLFF